jgi:hypothetical protein
MTKLGPNKVQRKAQRPLSNSVQLSMEEVFWFLYTDKLLLRLKVRSKLHCKLTLEHYHILRVMLCAEW